MFRGNHPARVDEKGRLKLPADFKAQLVPDGEGRFVFYITSKDGERAELWPLKAWEEIEEKLALLPTTHPGKRKFLDVTNYYGQMAEMDGQGRLLLPQLLREEAKLTTEVVVIGKIGVLEPGILEVVNHEQFKGQILAQPITKEDLDALAGFGL